MDGTRQQLDKEAATLAEAPERSRGHCSRSRRSTKADEALGRARKGAADRRAGLAEAELGPRSLAGEEQQAWAELRQSRDSVVALGAPPVEDADLAEAWKTLTAWARAQHADRARRQPELDERGGPSAAGHRRHGALTGLLAEHDITDVTDPARARPR